MPIICPTCAATYRSISAKPGQKVRCARCDATWRIAAADDPASDPAVIEVEATSERAQPARYEDLYGEAERPQAAHVAEKAPRRVSMPLVFAIGCVAVAMAAVGFRASIVKTAPQTGALFAAIGLPVNVKGLSLRNVTSTVVEASGQKMLAIEGEIANLRDAVADVPQLELKVRGADGRTLYTWTTGSPKSRLAGRETVSFRARLVAPPDEGRDVLVTFAGLTKTASR